jgi:hypothetical protein
VADGDAGDTHVVADDDGAGALVDNDARRSVGLDDEIFELREEAGGRNIVGLLDDDGPRILLVRDTFTETLAGIGIDGVGDADGGGEVGVP